MRLDAVPAGARVVVAMSGGVDSSAVAALLHEGGYEVVGVTLQLYDHGAATARKGACCAGQDIRDARDVAARLGIAHYVLDYESRFRDQVIGDFVDSYARGETPVPCIQCNRSVKFRDLLGVARDLGAAALATGHYARRVGGATGAALHRGADPARDQSYFLFATAQEQLAARLVPWRHGHRGRRRLNRSDCWPDRQPRRSLGRVRTGRRRGRNALRRPGVGRCRQPWCVAIDGLPPRKFRRLCGGGAGVRPRWWGRSPGWWGRSPGWWGWGRGRMPGW